MPTTQKVSYHYYNDYMMENLYWIVLGIVVVCLSIYTVLYLCRMRIHRREQQVHAREFTTVLNKAIQQRSRVFIRPLIPGADYHSERRGVFGLVKGMRAQLLLYSTHANWLEVPAVIFFSIINYDGSTSHYTIKCTVDSIEKSSIGVAYWITTTCPLLQTQRREFVRIAPPSSLIESVELSFSKATVHKCDCNMPSGNHIAWVPLPKGMFFIKDISAGGMRIMVNHTITKHKSIDVGDNVFVILKLINPKSKTHITMQLIGTCRYAYNIQSEANKPQLRSLGIMFSHEANFCSNQEKYVWRKIHPEQGVRLLVQWVMQSQFMQQKYKVTNKNSLNIGQS